MLTPAPEPVNPLMAPIGSPDEPAMVRMCVRLGYDGSGYNGWGIQPGLPTIQGAMEAALAMLLRRPVRTVVAGRTDAGVHARNQMVHFDITATEFVALARGAEISPERALVRRLRGVLTREHGTILIHQAMVAPAGFNARFSALWRRYSYRIADGAGNWEPLSRGYTMWHKREIDVELMAAEAKDMVGRHDFLAFCKPRERATTIRTLTEFSFTRDRSGIVVAHLKADAFCHNMVRALIGACVLVGDGREEPGWVGQRLEAGVRDAKTFLADPRALVLEEVAYPEAGEAAARAELTRARRLPKEPATATETAP
ncbi:tRNA pseudouridine(38-40) synthase TruA [Paeniglutamicibacter antarcticus]|uniref:tRNA pseudouridine synthase A n=1 Tax=Paeniglutamicibacter antarcticus TaxID=494023 RepID=A0ABP9TPZ1_9MICC